MKFERIWTLRDPAAVDNPESVYFDAVRSCIYVINTTEGASKTGYVSVLSAEGKVLERRFTQDLIAPRGSILKGNSLFVNQLHALTEIDCDTGGILAEYFTPESKMLNDPAVDEAGNVYSSDMFGGAIYRLHEGVFERWLDDPAALTWPNGLRAEGRRLYVAPWGIGDERFMTREPSVVKVIDLDTKEVHDLGCAAKLGPLDGLEQFDAAHLLVNNWRSGKVYTVDKRTGEAELALDTGIKGMGDIHYNESSKTLLCPIASAGDEERNSIIAYRLCE